MGNGRKPMGRQPSWETPGSHLAAQRARASWFMCGANARLDEMAGWDVEDGGGLWGGPQLMNSSLFITFIATHSTERLR